MAIYVKLTNGGAAAQTWSGSNLSVPFDGATHVIISAYSDAGFTTALGAGITQWTLLNAPAGTAFNAAWFAANNGGGPPILANPLNSGNTFILDKEGSWFFRCTRTDTSDSIDFIVSTNNVRTNTRIPAAGETTQSDQDTANHAYPGGSPSGQGWAKDRNYALDVLDDLSTSGGVQLCYFNASTIPGATAPWNVAPAGLKAGAALALTGAMHTINHVTGEQVPIVGLANGDTEPEYVGLFKSDTTGSNGTVTSVNTNRLIWVSRSGVVEAAPNVIDTTAFTDGEILFLSKTAGRVMRGSDRFQLGANKPTFSVPTCLVLNSNATGRVLTLPSEYLGGVSTASKSFRYSGIGDFSGLRVGSNDVGTAIDGELFGCVEMVAQNSESGTINAGTVCMLTYQTAGTDHVQAAIADANSAPTVVAAKREGIVCVAIENVAAGATGHFCIYGPVTAAAAQVSASANAAKNPGAPVYVGSSQYPGSTNQAGHAVLFDEVAGNSPADLTLDSLANYSAYNHIIPIGQLSNVGGTDVIMVGFHQETGYLDTVFGGLQNQTLPTGVTNPAVTTTMARAGLSYNKSSIQIQDSAATFSVQVGDTDVDMGTLTPDKTVIKVAGSGADDTVAQVDMYECKIPGTILYQSSPGAATGLDGTYDTATTFTGSKLDPSSANTLYGTFNYDLRCGVGINPGTHGMFNNSTRLKVYGITEGNTVSAITIKAKIRFNTKSLIDANGGVALPVAVGAGNLPTTNESPDYPFWTRTINIAPETITNTNNVTRAKQLCFDIALYDDGTAVPSAAGNKVGATGKPNLGLLNSGPMFDTTSIANQPVQNSFNNPILGLDIELVRTDANATTFLVTEVVLESEKRLHFPYARSVFEACWPAYALQTLPSGAIAVKNDTSAITGAGSLIGVRNDTGSRAGGAISTLTGFIPRDARAQTAVTGAIATSYSLRVDGKFSGPTNVAAPSNQVLGLKFYVKEVEASEAWNKTIASATPDVNGTIIPQVPVLSTAGSGEIANTSHMCPFASPASDNVIGWWFTVTRETSGAAPSGVYSGDINSAELFYLMTNVQLQGMFNDDVRFANTNIAENIYEQHILPSAMIDEDTNSFSPAAYGDVAGFNFPAGGADEAYFSSSFDYRYDDKSGVVVEIITAAKASGGNVIFKLDALYSDCGDEIPVYSEDNAHAVGVESVSNTTAFPNPANDVRFLKHSFVVPPQMFWSDKNTPGLTYGSPDGTAGANKGTVRWKLERVDSESYDVICLSASVVSDKSNKTSLSTVQPANINEDPSTSRDFSLASISGGVYVPSYPYLNYNSIMNLSVQRFTWQFVTPASTLTSTIAAAGEKALVPAAMGSYDLTTPFGAAAVFGHSIPYSFAITDVYGYCIEKDAGRGGSEVEGLVGGEAGTAKIAIDFRIMEVPQAGGDATASAGTVEVQDQIVGTGHDAGAGIARAIVFPGVQGFPFTVYPNAVGNIRWNASSMSNRPGDLTGSIAQTDIIPKALLPSEYKEMGASVPLPGHQWQLCCFVRNVSAGTILPLIHLSVEIALLPHYNDGRNALMGGALSSGTKKTY